ncbi:hypothetical protein IFM89_027518 [Coptis chinensis]|uniref:Uncharacterized protein n=1 Tax=Coptis chinensis TaxID=261450 RepID=A0A835I5Y5_9MAGN|nr:hypothetical protein IFM89_027518 [Coptis chinensis]
MHGNPPFNVVGVKRDWLHTSFNLEKKSGKKCFMIGARKIHISWGVTPQDLAVIHEPYSSGKIDTRMLSPKTTYGAYLVFKITKEPVAYAPFGELSDAEVPSTRRDGWMEIKLGQHYNDQGEDGEVEMKASVNRPGLLVEGIELRPECTST